MNRTAARAYVKMYAATDAHPVLSVDELDAVLDQSRIVDELGFRINEIGYLENVWATRAVVLALDVKVAKAQNGIDVTADGTTVNASQLMAQLVAQRKSWRSRMLAGSA